MEELCKQLYETADPNIRNEAEKTLVNFPNSPGCLGKCQMLLERAAVRYNRIKFECGLKLYSCSISVILVTSVL